MALVGCALGWPSATLGQQATMPVIGFLSSGQPDVFAHLISAFRQGLNEVGFAEGRNVIFEHRAAGNEYDRFRAMADDLVHRQVASIFANGGTAAALAAKAATSAIPIIFYMGGDPVRQGVVASINRPGGNVTGLAWFGIEVGAKRLELLGELLPNVTVTIRTPNTNSVMCRRPLAAWGGACLSQLPAAKVNSMTCSQLSLSSRLGQHSSSRVIRFSAPVVASLSGLRHAIGCPLYTSGASSQTPVV
jgi:hypothetical protein